MVRYGKRTENPRVGRFNSVQRWRGCSPMLSNKVQSAEWESRVIAGYFLSVPVFANQCFAALV